MKKTIQSVGVWGDSIMKGVLFNPEKIAIRCLKTTALNEHLKNLA